MKLAIATSAAFPALPVDEQYLVRAFGDRAEVVPWVWTDGDVPGDIDLVLLRATWDSHLDPDRYLAWVRGTAARATLLNPLELVEWNFQKRYLLELEAKGIPVVPTAFVERGNHGAIPDALARWRGGPIVVKPAISASAYRTRCFWKREIADDDDFAFAHSLVAERDILVQPLRQEVFTSAERSAIYIDGRFSHVAKRLPFGALTPPRDANAAPPVLSIEEERFCERVLAALPAQPLYARIDFIVEQTGSPLLMEVELIDPSLFFQHRPQSASELAHAVIAAHAARRHERAVR